MSAQNLHLICLKTEDFHAKFRFNLNDISNLSQTQKKKTFSILIITSFLILSPKYFYHVFLKITFPVSQKVLP